MSPRSSPHGSGVQLALPTHHGHIVRGADPLDKAVWGCPGRGGGCDGASPALPPQTIQGIQAKCFRTLPDLIGAYQHPNNGLATPLLHPVHRPGPDEDSGEPGRGRGLSRAGSGEGPAELVTLPTDGEDARGWGHTVPCSGAAPSSRTHIPQQLHQRLQEQVHSR